MKSHNFFKALPWTLAMLLLSNGAQAIKITVPDQYKDQVEAIKQAERKEREQELEGVAESAEGGIEIAGQDKPEPEKPAVDADEFLVQSVVEATDAATEFEGTLAADEGIVSGQVVDKETGEPVSGAAILIEGTDIATVTDDSGRYSLGPAPAGTYTLSFIKTGYIEANITEYTVAGGEVSVFPFALPPRPADMSDEVYELQDFTVTAEQANQLMANLQLRQDSIASLDILGSEDFSRFAASDAADALKSVTGVSISGGKFAVVRGLDDRFSTTSLNGIVVPSPDPDRLAVPLDIFPAGLLETISTQKSYTPDQPGESSGGAINLITKSQPETFTAKISVGVSRNENATGENDFLLAEAEHFQESPFRFAPKFKKPGLDTSYSGEAGGTFDLRGIDIGLIGGFSYSEKYSYSEVQRTRITSDGANAEVTSSRIQTVSEFEQQLSVLAGVSLQFSDETSLSYTGLHSAKNEAVGTFSTIDEGSADNPIFETSASTIDRQYWNHQLVLDHTFDSMLGFDDVSMILSYAYSENAQDEPDTRFSDTMESGKFPDTFDSTDFAQPVRYERFLDQEDKILKFDFEVPAEISWLDEAKFKFGYSNEDTVRVTEQREFIGAQFNDSTFADLGTSNPDSIINIPGIPPIIIPGNPHFSDIPGTTVIDSGVAEGTRQIRSVYLMGTLSPTEKLELTAGVRLEKSFIEAVALEPGKLTRFVFEPVVESAAIDESSVLPAFTATYDPTDKLKLRFGISQTIAKPSFRELNPNPTFNPSTGEAEIGNPGTVFQNPGTADTVLPPEFSGLRLVEVDNIDARAEWFFSPEDFVSVSLFHKNVDGPIERISVLTGGGSSFTFFNNDKEAVVRGAEFEARFGLAHFNESLRDFYLGANYTHIDATVERSSLEKLIIPAIASKERALFNQPENILNAYVSYRNEDLGLDVTLSANRVGRQLYAVTGPADIFIEPHITLNLVIGWKITEHFSVKFSAKNLLDPQKERSFDTFGDLEDTNGIGSPGGAADSDTDFSIRDSYRSGRSYGVSASYTF